MKYFKSFPVWILALGVIISSCRGRENRASEINSLHSGHYREQYRPQFHFSPEANWMNDPNGLVFFEGEYHLFYQYYPDSTVWGPMHWGHAISTNLTHWTHFPVALYPDSLGYVFSGSAVIDTLNTSGLGSEGKPAMVAIFTSHNPVLEKSGSDLFQNQCIAYSLDKGRNWTKYSGNPVLRNPGKRDFRDPKMFWNPSIKRWNMVMAVNDRVYIYSSPDIINWTFESEFGQGSGAHGGVWECPDLFPLKVEGTDILKWVMLVSINPGGPNGGSATQYFTGDFDGHKFTPESTDIRWVDWGTDDYAGVTFSNIPASDGRRIFIGWMSNWNYATSVPTVVWRSAMTIPRELSLKSEKGNLYLTSKPVWETGDLRIVSDTISFRNLTFSLEKELTTGPVSINQSEMLFGFNTGGTKADTLGLILENNLHERLIIGYSLLNRQFYIDRRNAGRSDFSKDFAAIARAPYKAGDVMKIHLFVDAASVEMFVDDGSLVMTDLIFPAKKYSALKLFSKGGTVMLNKAIFYGIKRIWN